MQDVLLILCFIESIQTKFFAITSYKLLEAHVNENVTLSGRSCPDKQQNIILNPSSCILLFMGLMNVDIQTALITEESPKGHRQ